MNKKEKIFSIIIVSFILMVLTGNFLATTFQYYWLSHKVKAIERRGFDGCWTENGWVPNWEQEPWLKDKYNEAKKAKKDFALSSSTGTYLYHAGKTSVGKFFRGIDILLLTATFGLSAFAMSGIAYFIVKSSIKKLRHRHRNRKNKKRKEESC